MAQAARKRPGSPIGKKGPRKANPIYKRRLGKPWSKEDLRELKALAKENTPTGVLSVKLQRPEPGRAENVVHLRDGGEVASRGSPRCKTIQPAATRRSAGGKP